jgi:HK97 family phage portal protein
MGWTSFLKRDVKSKAAPLTVQYSAQQPRFTPRQYDQLAKEGYQKNVIAYRCIKLIAQNAGSVPWAVYQGSGPQRKRLESHPLQILLSQPNPLQATSEFIESVLSFYLISGNSYIESVGPKEVAPRELWVLRPDRVRIIPGSHGLPSAYRYSVNGQFIDYQVDPVRGPIAGTPILHLKSFHPLDDWYGMSALEAAAISIDQHNDAAKWNASLLQSGGRPSGALVFKPGNPDASDTLTPDQRRVLKEELETHFTGPANAGRPLVLEGGLDWREMSLSPSDMDWLAGKDVSAREIAMAFHVPPQLVGIDGSMTFANFEQARLALFDDAILPLLDHVKVELNRWLSPLFGSDITLEYDVDKIEALVPRREKVWDRVTKADFMTINEKRLALGLAPLNEGGDIVPSRQPA